MVGEGNMMVSYGSFEKANIKSRSVTYKLQSLHESWTDLLHIHPPTLISTLLLSAFPDIF